MPRSPWFGSLTIEKSFQVVFPFLVIGSVGALKPDQSALEVVVWHGSETHPGIAAYDGPFQLPLRDARVQRLEENPHAYGHQGRKHAVEYEVEETDLPWKLISG